MGPEQVLQLQIRVDREIKATKQYSKLTRISELGNPHQIKFSVIPNTSIFRGRFYSATSDRAEYHKPHWQSFTQSVVHQKIR